MGPVISLGGQGADRALHRGGGGCRRHGAARRPERDGAGARRRVLGRSHDPGPRRPGDEDRAGGSVRSGAGHHPGRDVDQALAIENASPYGNAASVFTESGGLARYVTERASAGMVGGERGGAGAPGAVLLRRLERIQVRRGRHHRPRLHRVLDPGEEDHHEVESRSANWMS